MTAIDRRTVRRFPLAALLLANMESPMDWRSEQDAIGVETVARRLGQGCCAAAKAAAIGLTYASYHPSAWGL